MTSYIRKTADSKKTPVTFYLNKEVDAILVNGESFENGTALDLSEDVQVVLQSGGTEEIWTIKKPVISNNPCLLYTSTGKKEHQCRCNSSIHWQEQYKRYLLYRSGYRSGRGSAGNP